jgi:NADPH:quinone reductase-like Zn-dependent oxidoreductase
MSGYDRIIAENFGGPEILKISHVADLPEPGEHEVRIRVEAAGVGYTDTILRRGRYIGYTGGLPLTPGYDMVGRVDKLGAGVKSLKPGDRVADMTVSGAYSQYMVLPARDVFPVPAGLSAAAAIEVPLMWVTAWQMLTRIVSLPPGAPILVVGASGAVGRALVMLGRYLGHQVIGTCSAGNMELVDGLGATALDYHRPDLAEAIRVCSGGAGVAAAFDAIGGTSWDTAWQALAPGGILIAYGFQDFLESDAPAAVAGEAMQKLLQTWPAAGQQDGSKRQTNFYDIRNRRESHPGDYRTDALKLLELMAQGLVLPPQAELLALSQAADAHRRIAAGGLNRRLVLQP